MSLHRSLSLFAIVIVTLALGAAISLVVLTTYLHRTTVELETALQSVRVAEEMQIDLLTYIRTNDEFLRTTIESDLRQRLNQARQFANTPEEEEALADAQQLIDAHVARTPPGGATNTDHELERAFGALRRFIDVNVQQADASVRASERWDDIGDRIGAICSAALIIGIAAMLVWLNRVAFQPVFEIQRAIREFAAGSKDIRAPERGPSELRTIAKQFNEMAVSINRQYESQLSFLAAVAHDLRNPLGALRMSASILSSGRTLPPDTVSNLASIINRQVHALDRMVGDLLDTSRIEAGHLELRITECDLRNVAQDAFDLFNLASQEHQLNLALPESPVLVQCDPLRIQQVLNNLISNAIKYSPAATKIDVKLEEEEHCVRMEVADQGVGIAPEELAYIFEPFRRTKAAKFEVPGVGLGLSVAQRIVRAHGGQIHVESQVGKGSTFRVELPNGDSASRRLTA
jgi:two-component system, OmpR family, sensor histidine kinase MtrB